MSANDMWTPQSLFTGQLECPLMRGFRYRAWSLEKSKCWKVPINCLKYVWIYLKEPKPIQRKIGATILLGRYDQVGPVVWFPVFRWSTCSKFRTSRPSNKWDVRSICALKNVLNFACLLDSLIPSIVRIEIKTKSKIY